MIVDEIEQDDQNKGTNFHLNLFDQSSQSIF